MPRISANDPCDLLVIGGGSAGLIAAHTAVEMGARTVLAEHGRPGGDCLWTGCVPSKSLLAAANVAALARRSSEFGVHIDGVSVDFPAVMAHIQQVIKTIEPVDSFDTLREAGIEVETGHVQFVSPGTVEIDGRRRRFRQALIATGAAPQLPEIPGLADLDVLTSETIWDITALPKQFVIVGGAPARLARHFAGTKQRIA